jgi:hypothetical protein
MEPEGSLPHSQVPATFPILNQLNLIHTPTSHFLKIHLNIILPLSWAFQVGLMNTQWNTYFIIRVVRKLPYFRAAARRHRKASAPSRRWEQHTAGRCNIKEPEFRFPLLQSVIERKREKGGERERMGGGERERERGGGSSWRHYTCYQHAILLFICLQAHHRSLGICTAWQS